MRAIFGIELDNSLKQLTVEEYIEIHKQIQKAITKLRDSLEVKYPITVTWKVEDERIGKWQYLIC